MKKAIGLLAVMSMVSGCSSIGKLSIKQYTDSTGHKILAGRYKPEADNQCQLRSRAAANWGFNGHLDPDGTYKNIVTQATQRAPSLHANYVYIAVPSGSSGGENSVNNSVARIYYYNCKNPPS